MKIKIKNKNKNKNKNENKSKIRGSLAARRMTAKKLATQSIGGQRLGRG